MIFGDLTTRIGLAIAAVFLLTPLVRFLFRRIASKRTSVDFGPLALDKPSIRFATTVRSKPVSGQGLRPTLNVEAK
jgi:hypothetical protein